MTSRMCEWSTLVWLIFSLCWIRFGESFQANVRAGAEKEKEKENKAQRKEKKTKDKIEKMTATNYKREKETNNKREEQKLNNKGIEKDETYLLRVIFRFCLIIVIDLFDLLVDCATKERLRRIYTVGGLLGILYNNLGTSEKQSWNMKGTIESNRNEHRTGTERSRVSTMETVGRIED